MKAIGDRRRGLFHVRRRTRALLSLALVGVALLALLLFFRLGVLGAPLEPRYSFGVAANLNFGSVDDVDVEQLRAGWYVDWTAKEDPPRPAGLEFAQMIRLHQVTTCWPERTRDRTACPYVEPHAYTILSPGSTQNPGSLSDVAAIAQANEGSLWLIGNEMDRMDWEGGGQDEMLPELYAEAYYDLYHTIKDADASARVAIGGVVQPTPLRLEYLDKVVAEYQSRYGTMIPVDVWNIHNMILPEVIYQAGADIPPGSDAYVGRRYDESDAHDVDVFKQHVREFRQWMRNKGEQDKPLIISEYSVLYDFPYSTVKSYLYGTFDYMTTATSGALGYPGDGYRLVQRWAWYSLNDPSFEGADTNHHLFDPTTGEITQLGIDYGAYPDGLTMASVSLAVGWNHIALPVEPLKSYSAEELCDEVDDQGGQAVEVDRWHAGGWEGHICGLPFNNFPIQVGDGYFVRSDGASDLTLSGLAIDDPVPLDLRIGWNSVSVPHTDAYTAESLCDEIISQGVTAVEVDRWYAGGWEGHICGETFNDFPIEAGQGYLIKVGSAGEVTPAGE